ncbi:MAG: hypothetical protein ACREQ9_19285 [Candidatus Binatia bacterium]
MQSHPHTFPFRASLLALALLAPASTASGAQGFGASTPGGAGKPVYRVTNLNDSGAGSLRDAVSQGNRSVVFTVAGTIDLQSAVSVKGAFVTVDGFSAPAPGITLRNAGMRLSGTSVHDVVLRGFRIRNPGVNDSSGDGVSIKYGAYNVLVDHLSIDGCGDGSLDVTKSAHDVTVAWSVLSGCAKNVLIKYEATRVTLHHNVFVHSQWRNPWISNVNEGIVSPDTTVDMRNNLVWGWGDSGGGTGIECGAKANVVSNFFSSPKTSLDRQENALMVNDCDSGTGGLAYTFGNLSGDPLRFDLNSLGNRSNPFPAAFVNTHDACTGAVDALAGAGADPLDAVDLAHLSTISLTRCALGGGSAPAPSPSPSGDQLVRLRLAAGFDDAFETAAGKVVSGSRALQVGMQRLVGFRFADVTIPAGARIVSAHVETFATDLRDAPISVRYAGEAAKDSARFRSLVDDLSGRRRTSAFVDDRPAGWAKGYNPSPDLAAVVQEIVDGSGWTSGGHLTLFIADRGSSAHRKLASFNQAPKKAAVLVVTYEAP